MDDDKVLRSSVGRIQCVGDVRIIRRNMRRVSAGLFSARAPARVTTSRELELIDDIEQHERPAHGAPGGRRSRSASAWGAGPICIYLQDARFARGETPPSPVSLFNLCLSLCYSPLATLSNVTDWDLLSMGTTW